MLEQLNEVLRLNRLRKLPLVGSLFRRRLTEKLMDLLGRNGAIRLLKEKTLPFLYAFSFYQGLQESIYTAAAKTIVGVPQDLLFCPICYSTYKKEFPLQLNVVGNRVVSISCDEHGILCTYTSELEFLPLMRLALTHVSDSPILLERFFRIVELDKIASAREAAHAVTSTDELLGGKEIAEHVKKVLSVLDMKLWEHRWSDEEIDKVMKHIEAIRKLLDKYGKLVGRVTFLTQWHEDFLPSVPI